MILDAELAIGLLGHDCGPSGLITYIWDKKVRGENKGCAYKKAGWHRAGRGKRSRCADCADWNPRSADDEKTLMHKPFALAGRRP